MEKHLILLLSTRSIMKEECIKKKNITNLQDQMKIILIRDWSYSFLLRQLHVAQTKYPSQMHPPIQFFSQNLYPKKRIKNTRMRIYEITKGILLNDENK